MKIYDIELGMELKSRDKKNPFLCEGIDVENETVTGRMICKGGILGKRLMKDTVANIHFAQTVLAGFERNAG